MEISKAATNMYWKRWMKEYLPLLTLQNKWTKHYKNMKIGDIDGQDGVVSSAQLKMKDSSLHMPVDKLFVLEEAT